MKAAASSPGDLAARAGRLRKVLSDAASGPLVAAAEVIDIANNWSFYQAEAGDVDLNTWLERTFGRGRRIDWWNRRHEAVAKLGEAIRRTFHHEAAVWVASYVPAPRYAEVKLAIMRARKENHDNPLTLAQVRPIVYEVIGRKAPVRGGDVVAALRARVAHLEAFIKDAGLEVPPMK